MRQVKIKLRPSELGRTEGLDKACQCVSNRILNMVGRIYTVQINIDSLTIQCICASIGQIMVVRLGLHNNCVRGVIMVILGLYSHIEGICDRCSIITSPNNHAIIKLGTGRIYFIVAVVIGPITGTISDCSSALIGVNQGSIVAGGLNS